MAKTISQIINELEYIKATHGDIQVMSYEGSNLELTAKRFVTVSSKFYSTGSQFNVGDIDEKYKELSTSQTRYLNGLIDSPDYISSGVFVLATLDGY